MRAPHKHSEYIHPGSSGTASRGEGPRDRERAAIFQGQGPCKGSGSLAAHSYAENMVGERHW
eukprot:6111615-Alexandrium_andersonii.AAC.1